MADKSASFKDNVPGKYFVDDSCIACDACCVEAPRFFAMNDNDGHAFVKLQPISAEDFQEAENALAACPVEAIGNNG
jgi:ferredoxin